jgi:hypothetical protein
MKAVHGWGLFVALTLAVSLPLHAAENPMLVRDGASACQIVLPAGASPSEQQAARDVQSHVKECTGAQLPIVTEPAANAPMIVLGCGPVAKSLGVDPSADALGEQGYMLRTVGSHVVIAGTAAAGTLYGAYDFLETAFGVRWLAPGVTKTPAARDVPLPSLDRLVKPAFLMRDISYAWPGGDKDFRARQRENAGSGGPDNPQGIQHAHDGRCHSYFRYLSPEEFFSAHPEYFSEIGGVRRSMETQLCLTNPEVLDIVTERMLKRMKQAPEFRQYNFSQLDYYNYCQCPKCAAMNEQYGTTGGTQFWFVNQLAERTSKVYPDKVIGTLAYMYTEQPPSGLTMHPNAAVWLCHMFPSCDSHPIATCPYNADYKRRAEAWAKLTSHLYIWHYIVDFAHYYNPFPNFGAMAADMKFYRGIGVEGVFLQGMGNGGGGGEFSLLRPYYGMKLLWNPDADANAVMREFLEGYYGAAAAPIGSYIRLLQDKVDKENVHMHLYTNPAQGYLPDAVMDQATGLFDQAEAAVKDDAELLERVRVARMPLVYANMFPRNGYSIDSGLLTFRTPLAQLPEAMDFVGRMEKHGFQALREVSGEPSQMPMLCAVFNLPQSAPSIGNARLTADVVPFFGGRVLRVTDRQSGQCITANEVSRGLFFPFNGGEETRLGGLFSPEGMFMQFSVTETTPASITLTATAGGFELRRLVRLEGDAPTLTVESTFTNKGDKPREAHMRSHTEFNLGDLMQTRIAFTDRKGQEVRRGMKPIVDGLREGEHYLDQNAPKDAWVFTGTKGLKVTQSFDDAKLDYAWLYAYPDYLNELEAELWMKPVTLAPGESASFAHSITVEPMPK